MTPCVFCGEPHVPPSWLLRVPPAFRQGMEPGFLALLSAAHLGCAARAWSDPAPVEVG